MGVGFSAAVERDLVGVLEAVAAGRRPREAARALLALVQARPRRPRRPASPASQMWLFRLDSDCSPWWTDPTRPFRPAPAAGPLRADDLVACDHFRCRLLVRVCLQRQAARWPGGNRLKDGSIREKRAGVHAYCFAGCDQGKGYRDRTDYRPEEAWSKGRFSFFRPGSGEQRAARRAQLLAEPELTPDIDHPPGAPEACALDLEDAQAIRDTVEGRG